MASTFVDRLLESDSGRRSLQREGFILEVTEKILALMEEKCVTRAELARRLGVTPARISHLLGWKTNMTLGTLSEVFLALGSAVRIEESEPLRRSSNLQPMRFVWKLGDADRVGNALRPVYAPSQTPGAFRLRMVG